MRLSVRLQPVPVPHGRVAWGRFPQLGIPAGASVNGLSTHAKRYGLGGRLRRPPFPEWPGPTT
jgi:hypothetical protein